MDKFKEIMNIWEPMVVKEEPKEEVIRPTIDFKLDFGNVAPIVSLSSN